MCHLELRRSMVQQVKHMVLRRAAGVSSVLFDASIATSNLFVGFKRFELKSLAVGVKIFELASKIFNTVTGVTNCHTAIAPQHEHLISRKIK